jgi:hypothetical protein
MDLVGSMDLVELRAACAHHLGHEVEWRQKLSHPEYDTSLGLASGSSVGLNKYHTVVHEATLRKGHQHHQGKSQDGVCGRATCLVAYPRWLAFQRGHFHWHKQVFQARIDRNRQQTLQHHPLGLRDQLLDNNWQRLSWGTKMKNIADRGIVKATVQHQTAGQTQHNTIVPQLLSFWMLFNWDGQIVWSPAQEPSHVITFISWVAKEQSAFGLVGEDDGGGDIFLPLSVQTHPDQLRLGSFSEKYQDGRCFVEVLGKFSCRAFERGISQDHSGTLPLTGWLDNRLWNRNILRILTWNMSTRSKD